jgi:hypothetical protein
MYIGNPCFYRLKDQPEGVKPSWDGSMCSDCLFSPPPPNFYLFDMWKELYIVSTEEHAVLSHTGSHCIIIIIISNIISLLTLRKSKLTPFLGCHYGLFSERSLNFPEFFANSPLERLWSPLIWSASPPPPTPPASLDLI